jgi:hypothetical protein
MSCSKEDLARGSTGVAACTAIAAALSDKDRTKDGHENAHDLERRYRQSRTRLDSDIFTAPLYDLPEEKDDGSHAGEQEGML